MNDDQLEVSRRPSRRSRADYIDCGTSAGPGHPTSSLSAADLIPVLLVGHLRYDWSPHPSPGNDHLTFSEGHASPLLYSTYWAVGVVDGDELPATDRWLGARLAGNPTPVLPSIDVAAASLSQVLPAGIGIALAGKYLDKLPCQVWELSGDSDTAEDSIWEPFDKAGFYKLGNQTQARPSLIQSTSGCARRRRCGGRMFGDPSPTLNRMDTGDVAELHLPAGSMGPKIASGASPMQRTSWPELRAPRFPVPHRPRQSRTAHAECWRQQLHQSRSFPKEQEHEQSEQVQDDSNGKPARNRGEPGAGNAEC